MAVTAALSFYTTSPPARSAASGNLVLTNGGGAPVTVQSVSITGPKNCALIVEPQVPQNAPVVNGHTQGGGSNAPDFSLAAGATLSIGFTFVAVGGTFAASAIVSDGSNPTATQSITPV